MIDKSTIRIPRPLIILILCLVIGIPCGRFIKSQWERNRVMEDLDNRMKSYEEQLSSEVPNLCQNIDLPITGTYTAHNIPELELFSSDGDAYFYNVNAGCAVTLHADSDFDKLGDRDKYDILVSLYEQIGPIYEEFLNEYFPEYISNPNWEVLPKLYISYDYDKCEAYVQTPDHLYQYSLYYDDLYLLDGESYFLMDEDSKWNRKRRESSGSGSYSGSGSGSSSSHGSGSAGGYSYTDADDYADQNYEDYMMDGLDEDEAYEEAYDDW